MCDLVLAWARLDTLASQWVTAAFGMCTDSGPILLGNMDTKTKLDRLKALCVHHSMTKAAKAISNLQKTYAHYVPLRNAVAHSILSGQRKSDPDVLVFSPFKPAPGKLAHMSVTQAKISAMKHATIFARETGKALSSIQLQLVERPTRHPKELLEFPQFPDPNRQQTRENKRRQRPPRPQG